MIAEQNYKFANILPGNVNELNKILKDNEALVCKTDYGYKVIPLVPDVKKIYIEVTTLCNFDCTTCIRNSWEEELGHMDPGIFKSLLEQLKQFPELKSVHFGGFGEPLSHPDIFNMINGVKEMGLKVELITNGSLLTEEWAEKLIESGLDTLFVSLDGPEEKLYNDIRQGADFETVIKNIEAFNRIKQVRLAQGPELGIEFVLMKSNAHKLPEMAKLVDKLKARWLLVTNVLPYSKELKDEIVYDIDETLFPGLQSGLVAVRAQMPNMKLRTERYCSFVNNKALTVTREGNVAPCYALMHRYKCFVYGKEKQIFPYHLGNIKERTLKEIWTNPEYAFFRVKVQEFNFPSCTDCKLVDGCGYVPDNEADCWGNGPSCAECLWARRLIICP